MTLNRQPFSPLFALTICCGVVMLILSSAIAGNPHSIGWMQLSPPTSPPARSYLAMTYDPASGNVVMFGGFNGTAYLNDTWTFDGINWTRMRSHVSPPARANCQIAYDRVTQKVVLFGGYNGTTYLGDTWLWDGNAAQWKRVRPAHSPAAVTGPMLFTDPNGSVDVFGGFDGRFYQGAMWQWNGSDWIQLFPPMLPYGRSAAAVGVNNLTNEVVLFGGLADINPVNTWTYDGTTWTMQSPRTQPTWVYAGGAAFDSNLNSVILFGGGSGGVDQNSTWQWYRSNWTQLRTTQSPPPREGAGIAYDPAVGHLIIFGGQNGDVLLNDTWQLIP